MMNSEDLGRRGREGNSETRQGNCHSYSKHDLAVWKAGEIHSEESLQAERWFWEAWHADQGYDSELQANGQEKERVFGRFEEAGKAEHSQDRDDVVAH